MAAEKTISAPRDLDAALGEDGLAVPEQVRLLEVVRREHNRGARGLHALQQRPAGSANVSGFRIIFCRTENSIIPLNVLNSRKAC